MNSNCIQNLGDVEFVHFEVGELSDFTLSSDPFKVSENDFFLDVSNIACFRVKNGTKVFINPYKDADPNAIQLFLNGSVCGALLHQRGILPFHGTSFKYKEKGVTISGSSGVGKSSVAMAFCQKGGQLISDDITPVNISDKETLIVPLKSRVKLWNDSIEKLGLDASGLEPIRCGFDKYYLPEEHRSASGQPRLDYFFILASHNKSEFMSNELSGMAKYDALRKQIYRGIYLKGMPGIERKYFKQLLQLAANVRVIKITRPQICDIYDTMRFIENQIDR